MTRARTTVVFAAISLIAIMQAIPDVAYAWDPFVSENSDVTDGNAAAGEEDYDGALEAYGRAARRLPDEPRIHLNRGIALLHQEKHEEARQALLLASSPESPADVRADAYYNLGLSFYRSGHALAEQLNHEEAQQQFREAVDALRRSLRTRPGQPNAAWNYELARRRLAEQERRAEEQRQEQEDSEEQSEGEEDGSDSQDAPSDEQDGGEQGPQNDDPGESSGDSESDSGSSDEPSNEGEPESETPAGGDQQAEESPEGGDPEGDSPGDGGNETTQAPAEPDADGTDGDSLPTDVERVLDALQNSEENLQRHRARARARQQNRRPTMDW